MGTRRRGGTALQVRRLASPAAFDEKTPMATPGDRLRALLEQPAPAAPAIAELLDRMSHAERLDAVHALGGPRLQKRLYDAVAGAPPVSIDQIVPPDAQPLREFIYHGKNSLPAFTHFQKRFCRPTPGTTPGSLWGYNHTNIAWLVGPGYFLCHPVDGPGAAVDYRAVPPAHPPSWPAIKPNDRGASYFVYRGMVDHLRRVSQHVLIGSASRGGKELGNYFVLCREP
jgi:hypothetical protein